MPDDSSVPVFAPKDYKETFKVGKFWNAFCWLDTHIVSTLQKRTVTSEFAECDLSLTLRLSFRFLIPLESPRAEASKASRDCLNRHNDYRDKCLDFFQAYRDCKKSWVSFPIPAAHIRYANRSPRWNNARQIAARGLNGNMRAKATNIQSVLPQYYSCMKPITHPRAHPSLPSAYSAPRTQGQTRAAREQYRRHA